MKLGFDGHVLTGMYQGTRSTLRSLLQALAAHESRHEIIVYSEDPDSARRLLGTDRLRLEHLGRGGSMKRLLHILPTLFGRDHVDMGVFQYIVPLTGKHIVFVHDLLPITHPRFFPWWMRLRTRIFFTLAIRRSVLVLAVSEFTRREIELLYGLKPDRLRLVRNGPSFAAEAFARGQSTVQERYVLVVGRIEARKNVPLLVDAFLKAGVPNLRLVIVGSHDLGFSYRIPVGPHIEHRSGVDGATLEELYRGASLFVYPSIAEGFGLPLLDALLFGLPTIASCLTAMAEIGEGLAEFFDPTAPEAVDMLAGLIAGHFAATPIVAPTPAQRATLAARFSWRRAADDFLAAVDSIDPAQR